MGKDANLMQCFFGEHLLTTQGDDTQPVAIVESEKTAVICSIHYSKFVWIATGGKSGCNMTRPEVNKVLKGRYLHLFPDVDGINDWGKAADELRQQGFAVFVNDVIASNAPAGSKEDIADLILRARRHPDVPDTNAGNTPPPPPRWYVDVQGILRQYEAKGITGDQFLDLQDENMRQSGLTSREYAAQAKQFENNNPEAITRKTTTYG